MALVVSFGWSSYSAFLTKINRWISNSWNPGKTDLVETVVLILVAVLMLAYNVNANIRLWQQSVREGEYPYVDSQRKKPDHRCTLDTGEYAAEGNCYGH